MQNWLIIYRGEKNAPYIEMSGALPRRDHNIYLKDCDLMGMFLDFLSKCFWLFLEVRCLTRWLLGSIMTRVSKLFGSKITFSFVSVWTSEETVDGLEETLLTLTGFHTTTKIDCFIQVQNQMKPVPIRDVARTEFEPEEGRLDLVWYCCSSLVDCVSPSR